MHYLIARPRSRVSHLNAALALWRFCEASARYIFENISGDRVADTIMHELEDIRPASISRRDIIRDVFGGHVRAHEILEALRKLEAVGKARREKQTRVGGTAGKPRETWFAK